MAYFHGLLYGLLMAYFSRSHGLLMAYLWLTYGLLFTYPRPSVRTPASRLCCGVHWSSLRCNHPLWWPPGARSSSQAPRLRPVAVNTVSSDHDRTTALPRYRTAGAPSAGRCRRWAIPSGKACRHKRIAAPSAIAPTSDRTCWGKNPTAVDQRLTNPSTGVRFAFRVDLCKMNVSRELIYPSAQRGIPPSPGHTLP